MSFFRNIRKFFSKRFERNVDRNNNDDCSDKSIDYGQVFEENKCADCLRHYVNSTKIDIISSGSFGVVFSCQINDQKLIDSNVEEIFACKVYHFTNLEPELRTQGKRKSFMNDLMTKSLHHPNIVKYYASFQVYDDGNRNKLLLHNEMIMLDDERHELRYSGVVMEKLQGTVRDIINDAIAESERLEIFKQIGSALSYLYEKFHLCHADIKCDNVGIVYGTPNQYKLIDFGQCQMYHQQVYKNYLSSDGTNNPFGAEVKDFAHFTAGLAIPMSHLSISSEKLLKKHKKSNYENKKFQKVLEQLMKPSRKTINLDQALKMV